MSQEQAFASLFLQDSDTTVPKPNVDASYYLINGEIKQWTGKCVPVTSPIFQQSANKQVEIGKMVFITIFL